MIFNFDKQQYLLEIHLILQIGFKWSLAKLLNSEIFVRGELN